MRTRLIVGCLVLAAAVMISPAALAQTAPNQGNSIGRANSGRDAVVISNPGASSPGESGTSTQRVRRGGTRALPPHVVRQDRIQAAGEAPACVRTDVNRRDTPMTPREETMSELTRSWGANAGFDTCPASGAAAGGPSSPAQVAEAFLRSVPLPLPEPAIAPDGRAITGLAAFLETNGALAHATRQPTPLGPVEVEATGEYFVDWGDGSPEAGPFAFEGEPYPSGQIFHHYRWTGDYTVVLRTRWNARWRLGGDSGTVEGLRTEASVPVEVFQVQAVIRR